MIEPHRLSLVLLVLWFTGMGSVADVTEAELESLEPLQPLDARVEDVSVLSTSLRVESPGLALPSNFDQVYRVPGDPNKLMRVNGALYAVFSQSVYGNYKGHVYAQVPPATVFHIGAPPSDPTAMMSSKSSVSSVSSKSSVASVKLEPEPSKRAGYGTVAPAGPDSHVGFSSEEVLVEEDLPRFVRDKSYRSHRLAEMVDRRIRRPGDQ